MDPEKWYLFQERKAAEHENNVPALTFYYLHTPGCFACLSISRNLEVNETILVQDW